MKFNLEKEIHFNVEPDHKNLYPWSLREKSESQKVERDLIPWTLSLYFTATEVRHHTTYKIDKELEMKDGVEEKELISAVLTPGSHNLNCEREGEPFYSMFGTDRPIQKFTLSVQKTDADKAEECTIWGCVSYTSEMDFRMETTEDEIMISLRISASRFENIKELITANRVDVLQVRLGRVSGFYSEWSPSITTRRIKVLAQYKDQSVISSSDSEITPPRLGSVGEFVLDIIQRNKIDSEPSADELQEMIESAQPTEIEEDDQNIQKESANSVEMQFYQSLLTQMSKNELVLSQLRTLIWLVVILLGLVALKLWL